MDGRELTNFFQSRGADADCPICGHDGDWVRVQEDRDLAIPVAELPAALRVTALLCENCGFIRMHSVDAIRNKINYPGESPTDD